MPEINSTTPPSDEPPVFTWHPSASSTPPWLPAPSTAPRQPELHSPTAPKRSREGGIISAIGAGLFAFFKYGVLLLKVAKLGPTLISMVVALFFYTLFFGWEFAIGVVLLILVHETGHVLVSRQQGIAMSLPVFLGPFGAFTRMHQQPRDARQEAIIAIGGPVFGAAGAFAVFVWALAVPAGHFHFLLLALAYFGFFMNLFNLIPMSPLDGGRVANAISKWMNVVGIAIMAVVAFWLSNPFAIIILILGVITTFQRFRNARRGLEPAAVPPSTRFVVGAAWMTMLAVCLIGMSVTHTAIVTSNFVTNVGQSSGSV